MAWKLFESGHAKGDVEAIVAYLSDELCNDVAAGSFLDKLDETYYQLKDNPLIFALARIPELAQRGFRVALVGSYAVIFRADELRKEVRLYRVLYGRRDYSRLV